MIKIAVLVSGSGSNLQALIDANLSGQIVGVISNKPEAFALQRAKNANIATAVIEHKQFPNREAFDDVMHQQLLDWDVDLVILAGFMRILTAPFVEYFQHRILNIHPSLLPSFTGLDTHERALQEGVKAHGCTVHFVTPILDVGPIVAQAVVPVLADDDADSLAARVLTMEHKIYPAVVDYLARGIVSLDEQNRVVFSEDAQTLFVYQA